MQDKADTSRCLDNCSKREMPLANLARPLALFMVNITRLLKGPW